MAVGICSSKQSPAERGEERRGEEREVDQEEKIEMLGEVW